MAIKFVGTKKHGCKIDSDISELVYYDYLNLIEKLKKKKQILIFKYSEIQSITLLYGLTIGVRYDAAQITIRITTSQMETYDIPITYNNTDMEDVKSFISIMLDSGLKIIDPYDMLNNIFETKLDIIDFIKDLNKKVDKINYKF